jgi:MFS family permease
MRPMGRLRWKMLALMLVGTIVIYVDRNVLGVLAPILKKDLSFTTEQNSYVVSSFQIVYSFAQPVAGYLTDRIGPRIGYAVAAVIWGLAAALQGLASGWISMAGFRALLGLSEAVAIPTGTKMSTVWFPSQERSIATGWFNSGSSIGSMVTPPLVIRIYSVWVWRPAFSSSARSASYWGSSGSGSIGIPRRTQPRGRGAGVYLLRTRAARRSQAFDRSGFFAQEVSRHRHRPLPDRAGLANLRLLDSALHGLRARYGHQAVRAVRLVAVPVFRHRMHFWRLSRAFSP